jgi:DNA-binding response OmpR family regulator
MDSTGSVVQAQSLRFLSKTLSSLRDSGSADLAGVAATSVLATVLLLEDDLELAALITEYLGHRGYRTLAVADVELACALAQRRSVAVVLLNWRLLGKLGGSDLVDELRRRSPHSHLPMIVISAEQRELLEADKLGIDDYLPNPFHPDDLVHVVDEYCR